jgi:hypothetical protein
MILALILSILLSTQFTARDKIVHTRLRIYERQLNTCGYFFITQCTANSNSVKERDRCLVLLNDCTEKASASYKIDTGKEPPIR